MRIIIQIQFHLPLTACRVIPHSLSIETLNQRNGGEWLKVSCGSLRGDNKLGIMKNSELPDYAAMISEVIMPTLCHKERCGIMAETTSTGGKNHWLWEDARPECGASSINRSGDGVGSANHALLPPGLPVPRCRS
ncbi:uncharacterized protein EpC_31230 [Erwinia pyrifoliae Ep1/96]|nr:uncharacterized protein EpC_31230 [Erwinia pyrifoliae Ep1/96]